MYDIAIIGAGPAGATAARLLGGRYSVLLLDKRTFGASGRVKCCAGLVAQDGQRVLASLGRPLPGKVLVEPQVSALRLIDMDSRTQRFLSRRYANVDRDAFDRWLVSLVPARVKTAFDCTVRGCRRAGSGHEVAFTNAAGRRLRAAAAVVVAADGAGSAVRRQLFPGRPAPPAYLAIQEWFRCVRPRPHASIVLDRRTTDYCGWAIPKDGELVVGAALRPGPGAAGRFELFKGRLARFGFSLGRPVRRCGAMYSRSGPRREVFLGDGGAALVGEAAGLVSPEGISFALASGALLAGCMLRGLKGFPQRYLRAIQLLTASGA
ncbi:MAG: oxidoreductase [Elusimicrobia bacterium]|nr:oxidoreductase [Elusimicrobiota bacterium]